MLAENAAPHISRECHTLRRGQMFSNSCWRVLLDGLAAARAHPRPGGLGKRVNFDTAAPPAIRPNGPGDPSPGMRPQADSLGPTATTVLRPERPREPPIRWPPPPQASLVEGRPPHSMLAENAAPHRSRECHTPRRGQMCRNSSSFGWHLSAARKIQQERFGPTASTPVNAAIGTEDLRRWCTVDDAGRSMLDRSFEKIGFSTRALDRILKVARTIADLLGSDAVPSPSSRRDHPVQKPGSKDDGVSCRAWAGGSPSPPFSKQLAPVWGYQLENDHTNSRQFYLRSQAPSHASITILAFLAPITSTPKRASSRWRIARITASPLLVRDNFSSTLIVTREE